jgi:cytochrome c-type biogenesis protein
MEVGGVAVAWAFMAGVVSFLSPCVLPLVPGYVSYVAGHSVGELAQPGLSQARLATLRLSGSFVVGFSLVFMVLGASASVLGQALLSYRGQADLIAGIVVAGFGLHLMGALRIPLLDRDWRFTGQSAGGSARGALVLGSAFAFGWTPCIGPILGSILMLGAVQASVPDGVLLLAIYSAGLAIPFLLVAAFTATFMRRLRGLRRTGRSLQFVTGAILVGVGVAMAFGVLKSFGTWLLISFPVFQSLVI